MTITAELFTIISVGVALAGVIMLSNSRHSRDIGELRQQMSQQGQQITQIAQEVGRLAGLLEGLRGRPIVESAPDGN